MKNIFYIILILFMSGCLTKRSTVTSHDKIETIITKDSILYTVKETVRLDTFYLVDSSYIKMLAECDDQGRIRIKEIRDLRIGRIATPIIQIRDSFIYLECRIDSFAVYTYWHDKYVREVIKSDYSKDEIEKTETTVKIIRSIFSKWWIWVIIVGGVIFFVAKIFMKNTPIGRFTRFFR